MTFTPFHFGARGDGQTDDTAALTAFFDHLRQHEVRDADISGTFAISAPLDVICDKTTHFPGQMRLTSLGAMKTMMRISGGGHSEWGSISVTGTGATWWGTFGTEVGLALDGCERAHIGKVQAENFAFAGLTMGDNKNTLATVDRVHVTDCGSGHTFGTGGTWVNPVRSGNPGSVAQRCTVDVDTMPPDFIMAGDYVQIGTMPLNVRIGGRLYYVYGAEAGQLTIYPWLPDGAVSGDFGYVFGGGVVIGGEASVVGIGMIDAMRCGVGLSDGTLYNTQVQRLVAQSCGAGLLLGAYPANANKGARVSGVYSEGNAEDVVLGYRGSSNAHATVHLDYTPDLQKVHVTGYPRGSDGTVPEPLTDQCIMVRGAKVETLPGRSS